MKEKKDDSSESHGEITSLLLAWHQDVPGSLTALHGKVEPILRRFAHRLLRRESYSSGFCTTELLNEAYLELLKKERPCWISRQHFFRYVAALMENFLVDRARYRNRKMRGGGVKTEPLHEFESGIPSLNYEPEIIISIHSALEKLRRQANQPLLSEVIGLRFFGGFSIKETAEILEVPVIKVNRLWHFGRNWLFGELSTPLQSEKPGELSSEERQG